MTSLSAVDLQVIQNMINQKGHTNSAQMSHSIQSTENNHTAEWDDNTFYIYNGEDREQGIKMVISEEGNRIENITNPALDAVTEKTSNLVADGTITQFGGTIIVDGSNVDQESLMDVAEALEWQQSPEPGMKFTLHQLLQTEDELRLYYDYANDGYKTWLINETIEILSDGTLTAKGEPDLTLPIRRLSENEYIIYGQSLNIEHIKHFAVSLTPDLNRATITDHGIYLSTNEADYGRFVHGVNGANGFAEIATSNEGTEPIYVRQYEGSDDAPFQKVKNELTLLDPDGVTRIPNLVVGLINGVELGSLDEDGQIHSINENIAQVKGDINLLATAVENIANQLGDLEESGDIANINEHIAAVETELDDVASTLVGAITEHVEEAEPRISALETTMGDMPEGVTVAGAVEGILDTIGDMPENMTVADTFGAVLDELDNVGQQLSCMGYPEYVPHLTLLENTFENDICYMNFLEFPDLSDYEGLVIEIRLPPYFREVETGVLYERLYLERVRTDDGYVYYTDCLFCVNPDAETNQLFQIQRFSSTEPCFATYGTYMLTYLFNSGEITMHWKVPVQGTFVTNQIRADNAFTLVKSGVPQFKPVEYIENDTSWGINFGYAVGTPEFESLAYGQLFSLEDLEFGWSWHFNKKETGWIEARYIQVPRIVTDIEEFDVDAAKAAGYDPDNGGGVVLALERTELNRRFLIEYMYDGYDAEWELDHWNWIQIILQYQQYASFNKPRIIGNFRDPQAGHDCGWKFFPDRRYTAWTADNIDFFVINVNHMDPKPIYALDVTFNNFTFNVDKVHGANNTDYWYHRHGYIAIRQIGWDYSKEILDASIQQLEVMMDKNTFYQIFPDWMESGENPLLYIWETKRYRLLPEASASTYLHTPYNIVCEGVIQGEEVQTYLHRLNTVGNSMLRVSNEVAFMENQIAQNAHNIGVVADGINEIATYLEQIPIKDESTLSDIGGNVIGVVGEILEFVPGWGDTAEKILEIGLGLAQITEDILKPTAFIKIDDGFMEGIVNQRATGPTYDLAEVPNYAMTAGATLAYVESELQKLKKEVQVLTEYIDLTVTEKLTVGSPAQTRALLSTEPTAVEGNGVNVYGDSYLGGSVTITGPVKVSLNVDHDFALADHDHAFEYSPLGHTHGQYALLEDIENLTPTPLWSSIQQKPATYPPEAHTHAEYALQTDMETLIDEKIAEIDLSPYLTAVPEHTHAEYLTALPEHSHGFFDHDVTVTKSLKVLGNAHCNDLWANQVYCGDKTVPALVEERIAEIDLSPYLTALPEHTHDEYAEVSHSHTTLPTGVRVMRATGTNVARLAMGGGSSVTWLDYDTEDKNLTLSLRDTETTPKLNITKDATTIYGTTAVDGELELEDSKDPLSKARLSIVVPNNNQDSYVELMSIAENPETGAAMKSVPIYVKQKCGNTTKTVMSVGTSGNVTIPNLQGYSKSSHTHSTYAEKALTSELAERITALEGGSNEQISTIFSLVETLMALHFYTKEESDTRYAAIGHDHDERYANVQTVADLDTYVKDSMDGLSNSIINHNHDERYSLASHNHDERYSLASHNHAGTYATVSALDNVNLTANGAVKSVANVNLKVTTLEETVANHNHDSKYAEIDHEHEDLETAIGDVYTQLESLHELGVTVTTHNHDNLYAQKEHTHTKIDNSLNVTGWLTAEGSFDVEGATRLYGYTTAHSTLKTDKNLIVTEGASIGGGLTVNSADGTLAKFFNPNMATDSKNIVFTYFGKSNAQDEGGYIEYNLALNRVGLGLPGYGNRIHYDKSKTRINGDLDVNTYLTVTPSQTKISSQETLLNSSITKTGGQLDVGGTISAQGLTVNNSGTTFNIQTNTSGTNYIKCFNPNIPNEKAMTLALGHADAEHKSLTLRYVPQATTPYASLGFWGNDNILILRPDKSATFTGTLSVGGVDLLAKIEALEARIAALEEHHTPEDDWGGTPGGTLGG